MPHPQKPINIRDLLLDPQNPRLPLRLQCDADEANLEHIETSQNKILEHLGRTSSIAELVSAIAENGYFEGEALLATPVGNKFVVIEGNRRLTALMILQGSAADTLGSKITELVNTAKNTPVDIPTIVYDERDEVLTYLGNRHIAGVKAWGPLAKARYIQQLFDRTNPKTPFEDRCREVAKTIGSRRDYISKNLRAYHVYKAAEREEFFGLEGLDEESLRFSVLYTSIDYSDIDNFIFEGEDDERELNSDRLRELLEYMFVPREGDTKPPLGESRNIGKLAKILSSAPALGAFRNGASISSAYLKSEGVEEDFDRACFEIIERLRHANSLVAEVEASGGRIDQVTAIWKQVRRLKMQLEEDDGE